MMVFSKGIAQFLFYFIIILTRPISCYYFGFTGLLSLAVTQRLVIFTA